MSHNTNTEAKVLCLVCGFLVRPTGHESRCRLSVSSSGQAVTDRSGSALPQPVRGSQPASTYVMTSSPMTSLQVSALNTRAWLGDAQHCADVRVILVCSNLPDKERGAVEASLRSRGEQAQFWERYDGGKFPPSGSSAHSVSTAFEASYDGRFRRAYLQSVCKWQLTEPLCSRIINELMSHSLFGPSSSSSS